MERVKLSVLVAVVLSMMSCQSNEVEGFIAERKTVTDEMAKSLSKGNYDQAKSVFDAKKASLKSQCSAAKAKVTDQQKWANAQINDSIALAQAATRGGEKVSKDLSKMMSLVKEHSSICN
jgi:plasmid maintenance system antidote protein VapI